MFYSHSSRILEWNRMVEPIPCCSSKHPLLSLYYNFTNQIETSYYLVLIYPNNYKSCKCITPWSIKSHEKHSRPVGLGRPMGAVHNPRKLTVPSLTNVLYLSLPALTKPCPLLLRVFFSHYFMQ